MVGGVASALRFSWGFVYGPPSAGSGSQRGDEECGITGGIANLEDVSRVNVESPEDSYEHLFFEEGVHFLVQD